MGEREFYKEIDKEILRISEKYDVDPNIVALLFSLASWVILEDIKAQR